MARDLSAIWGSLLDRVKKRGCSEDEILRLAAQGDTLLDKFADVMAEAARKPIDIYPVSVNYELSVADAIDAGKYQAVNTDITDQERPGGSRDYSRSLRSPHEVGGRSRRARQGGLAGGGAA
jgi:hypothetical protein